MVCKNSNGLICQLYTYRILLQIFVYELGNVKITFSTTALGRRSPVGDRIFKIFVNRLLSTLFFLTQISVQLYTNVFVTNTFVHFYFYFILFVSHRFTYRNLKQRHNIIQLTNYCALGVICFTTTKWSEYVAL